MHRSIKVRIKPNKTQTEIMNKTFAAVRFRWNYGLEEKNNFYDNNIKGKGLSKKETSEIWKTFKPKTEAELKTAEDMLWLQEVSSVPLVKTGRDLKNAWFKFNTGKIDGTPKFKSKYKKNSYYEYMNVKFDPDSKKIKLPKLGWVRIMRSGKWPNWYTKGDKVCSITVSRDTDCKYYASILIESNDNYVSKSYLGDDTKCIGLDMSPDHFYVDSNGNYAPGYIKVKQDPDIKRHLTHLQRNLARKNNGSRNFGKAKLKLAKYEKHIANIRRDWREKEALRLVQTYNVIGIESLDIKGLETDSYNAKNYVDLAWYDFTQLLLDKAQFYNCIVIKADKYFASSQLCSECGYKNEKVKDLSVRQWTCPSCGTEHNRDVNAAINLRDLAIKEAKLL